ncbi:747_t:CDS:1, partial [Entrophospora sp. SA101]
LNVFMDFTTVDKWNLTENKTVNEIFQKNISDNAHATKSKK